MNWFFLVNKVVKHLRKNNFISEIDLKLSEDSGCFILSSQLGYKELSPNVFASQLKLIFTSSFLGKLIFYQRNMMERLKIHDSLNNLSIFGDNIFSNDKRFAH